MPNKKTDSRGFSTKQADKERDLAAKGGPAEGLGNPDVKNSVSAPYDEDLQTQMAAKSQKKESARTTDNPGK